MYLSDNNLAQIFYGRAELRLSDHRPVLAVFEVKARKVNKKAKQEIKEKLMQKFKSLSNSYLLNEGSTHREADTSEVSESSSNQSPQPRVSRLSNLNRLIEPSIGDFGLLEHLETARDPFVQEEPSEQLESFEELQKRTMISYNDMNQIEHLLANVYPSLLQPSAGERQETSVSADPLWGERSRREEEKWESPRAGVTKVLVLSPKS